MWNVAYKDPLGAETVGERRERKSRGVSHNSGKSSGSTSSDTARTFDLTRENIRISRSSNSVATASTPATSPLHEVPNLDSRVVSDCSSHGDLAEVFDIMPTSQRSDSALRDRLRRARVKGQRRDQATESVLQLDQSDFFHEVKHHTDRQEGIRDTTSSKRQDRGAVAPSPTIATRFTGTLSYHPKPHSWAQFASHPEAEAEPQQWAKLPATESMIRFQRLLGKIEAANSDVSCRMLSEQWEGNDLDLGAEFRFETALWVLVGLQKLSDLAQSYYLKSAPSYCVDGPSMVRIEEGMHVLHIGPIKDSPGAWFLGAKNSLVTFCSLATVPSPFDLPTSSWGWPPNVDSKQWDSCPIIANADNTFDSAFIQPMFHVLRCTDWPILIKEAIRVLIPGRCLAIQVMDPIPKRAGPLLEAWATRHLLLGLARKFMVPRPNLLLPSWLEEVEGITEMVVEAIELPVHAFVQFQDTSFDGQVSSSSLRRTHQNAVQQSPLESIDEDPGAQKIREKTRAYASLVGKHIYQSMYEEFASLETSPRLVSESQPQASKHWWWDDPAILDECRRFDSAFELVVYICRKGEATLSEEGESE